MDKIKKNDKLISLNDKLTTDYSIEELEQRLETNPLFFGMGGNESTNDNQVMPRGNCTEVNESWCILDNACVDVDIPCITICLDLPGCITK